VLLKLLSAPVSLPVAGLKFVLQQVADLADRELNDEAALREQLLLLQVLLEDGDIDEAEYAEREADLLARLRGFFEDRQRLKDEDEVPPEANVQARRQVIVETPFDE
jgi:hypothetical protein